MFGGRPNEVAVFGFERLDVYRLSVELLPLAWRLADDLAPEYAALAERLRRAALAVPLPIAEGTADGSAFALARGSALECAAILDALRALGAGRPELLLGGRALLLRIVNLLAKLAGAG